MPIFSSWMPLGVIDKRAEVAEDTFRYFERWLKSFDLTEALFFCASINLLVSDGRTALSSDDQLLAFKTLFLDQKCREKVRKWLLTNQNGNLLVGRPQLIELFKWIGLLSSDLHGNVSREMPNEFLKSIIMAGNIWQKRQLEPRFSSDDADEKNLSWEDRAFKSLPAFREMMLWSTPNHDPLKYLGRTKILLIDDMFARNNDYAEIFTELTGVDLATYVACLVGIETVGFPIPKEKYQSNLELRKYGQFPDSHLWQNIPLMQLTFEKVLSQLAMTPDEWKSELTNLWGTNEGKFHDIKRLHQKPMMRDKTGRCIIIDQRIFVESATVGPVFLIASQRNSKEVFGQFGMAFERYARQLCHRIYDKVVSSSERYFFSSESERAALIESSGNSREISDIVLREGRSLVLGEAKAVFLSKKILREQNPDDFWRGMRNKLGVSINPKSGREKRKGIAQLADAIKGVASGDWVPVDLRVTECVEEIFPLLIAYDGDLRAPNFLYFFARDFAKLLGYDDVPKEGFMEIGKYRVHNLILLTADDLEMWEFKLSTKPISDHLREFSQLDPLRRLTFRDDYLLKIRKLAKLATDSWLNQEALSLLDFAKEKFFPDSGKRKV